MAKEKVRRKPYLWEALLCIVLVVSLYFVLIRWGGDAHMALVISAVLPPYSQEDGISWDEL